MQRSNALNRRLITGKLHSPDTTPPTVPVHEPKFLPSRETSKLRATWLGHACFYVEFPGGLRVLFDPVFEHRCSPVSWLGPARFTKAPCQIEDIPIIDVVVISHAHYDHLSYHSVLAIQAKHPNCQFFAPLGNKAWFQSIGIHNITELDWWDTRELQLTALSPSSTTTPSPANPTSMSALIGCTPCQHMANRSFLDRNHTLWASWVVASGRQKVWFGGDTGYRSVPEQLAPDVDDYGAAFAHLPHCPAFAQIGRLRGPFDLGLIPIGAYAPRYLFSGVHANPVDSVNIFGDTQCRRALGMHWGTWVLTEEEVLEPPRVLKEALRNKGIAEGVFDVCDIGESREF
jgi:N-acyl-phosphatidylethanolamine-hydrolysing phospholipase D